MLPATKTAGRASAVILLDESGHAVVTDLGIAHVTDDAPENISAAMPRNMTIADGKAVAIGTPGYGAPEQFSCGDVSPASDNIRHLQT